MKYETYIPTDILKSFIRILAISESEVANDYKVLPGTELVIGFQYKGKLSYNDGDRNIPLASSGLTGLSDQYRIFSHEEGIGSVLVFFKEGAVVVPTYFQDRKNSGLEPYVGVVMQPAKDVVLDFGNGTTQKMVSYDDGIFIASRNNEGEEELC